MRSIRVATLVAAVMVALTACGGSGSGDPTAVVKQAFALVEQKKFDEVASLACAAKQTEVADRFDFANQLGSEVMPGLDAQKILDAMSFTTSGLAYSEKSRSGDSASVAVTGSIKMSVDLEKFKVLLKDIAAQQGQPIDDAQLDQLVALIGTQLNQEIPFDETVTVVKEGGSWKICG